MCDDFPRDESKRLPSKVEAGEVRPEEDFVHPEHVVEPLEFRNRRLGTPHDELTAGVFAKPGDRLFGCEVLERLPDRVVVAVDVAVLPEDSRSRLRPRGFVVFCNLDLPAKRDMYVSLRADVIRQSLFVYFATLGQFVDRLDGADASGVRERSRPLDGRLRLPATPDWDRFQNRPGCDREIFDAVELAVERHCSSWRSRETNWITRRTEM